MIGARVAKRRRSWFGEDTVEVGFAVGDVKRGL
jgi:hypothetical protein